MKTERSALVSAPQSATRLHLTTLGVHVVCRVVSWSQTLEAYYLPPMAARWLLSTWRRGAK